MKWQTLEYMARCQVWTHTRHLVSGLSQGYPNVGGHSPPWGIPSGKFSEREEKEKRELKWVKRLLSGLLAALLLVAGVPLIGLEVRAVTSEGSSVDFRNEYKSGVN